MADRYQTRMRNRREADILLVAEDRLATHGCMAFSVDEVAMALGIARGTIYRHFPNRQALIAGVLDRAAARVQTLFDEGFRTREEADVIAAIAASAKRSLAVARGHRDATGHQQLCYPCCLTRIDCPFDIQGSLVARIAGALDGARANGELAGTWWGSTAVADVVRLALGVFVARAPTESLPELEARVDLLADLLRRSLSAAARFDS